MFIALGQFQLKQKKQLFKFLRMSKKIELQAKTAEGNQSVTLLGGNLSNFYVISTWESKEDILAFSRSGFHLEAIKLSNEIATEIRLIYFEGEKEPTKKEVKELLANDDRVRVLSY